MEHMQITKDQMCLIGDTEYDVIGADQFGIRCIGVSYGFGKKRTVRACGGILCLRQHGRGCGSTAADAIEEDIMKTTGGFKLWQIIYPIGIYYVVSSLMYFVLGLFWGMGNRPISLRQLICSAATIPATMSFY